MDGTRWTKEGPLRHTEPHAALIQTNMTAHAFPPSIIFKLLLRWPQVGIDRPGMKVWLDGYPFKTVWYTNSTRPKVTQNHAKLIRAITRSKTNKKHTKS